MTTSGSPLRIALVAPPWLPVPPLGYGGTERVIALLADGLVESGYDVTLFAANGSDTAATLVSPLVSPPPIIGDAPDDEAFHTLAAFQSRHDFDLIHDHTGLGPSFAGLLADGPPVVHTLHGPWTPGLQRKMSVLHEHVNLVAISHSQKAANRSVEYAGVVHNGIDIDAHPFQPVKEDFLVFLGRINPDKAPEVAIEVAREAGSPADDDHQAVGAGRVGVLEREGGSAPRCRHHRHRAARAPHQGRPARPRPCARLPDPLAGTVRPRVRGSARVRHAGDHPAVRRRTRDRHQRTWASSATTSPT